MASVFGHALLAGALGTALPRKLRTPSVILLGMGCAMMPDADVLSFRLGIQYGEMWGHRGLTHSLLFGLLFGVVIALSFHRRATRKNLWILMTYYSICTMSHGVLDGLTTGGMGVAYFSPFDTSRYFLPFRVIQVSPLRVSQFFDEWGLAVLRSEAVWIGIPSVCFMFAAYLWKRVFSRDE